MKIRLYFFWLCVFAIALIDHARCQEAASSETKSSGRDGKLLQCHAIQNAMQRKQSWMAQAVWALYQFKPHLTYHNTSKNSERWKKNHGCLSLQSTIESSGWEPTHHKTCKINWNLFVLQTSSLKSFSLESCLWPIGLFKKSTWSGRRSGNGKVAMAATAMAPLTVCVAVGCLIRCLVTWCGISQAFLIHSHDLEVLEIS